MGCHADGLLAGCSIDHQQRLLGPQKFFQLFQFLNQRCVDFLATSGIEDVEAMSA